MTPKQFVKRAMEHIRELGREMSNEEYCDFLEDLSYELETEREDVNWQVLTSEGKII
ncbi:hypothetical protein [Hallella bergensis]|uniref:hypothetical protein n=1 Tax=Hallella bergensis TaxID=242750 RepID=UPI00399097E3